MIKSPNTTVRILITYAPDDFGADLINIVVNRLRRKEIATLSRPIQFSNAYKMIDELDKCDQLLVLVTDSMTKYVDKINQLTEFAQRNGKFIRLIDIEGAWFDDLELRSGLRYTLPRHYQIESVYKILSALFPD
jgi:hypothetical protein